MGIVSYSLPLLNEPSYSFVAIENTPRQCLLGVAQPGNLSEALMMKSSRHTGLCIHFLGEGQRVTAYD